ncbi:Forkhead-associated (FHA) domain protein [Moelleriella libera RCEF 2490]|uniref:Forkhead-associated (FHA) domain protein n=1 Tax=Moelleriella libera RCEF 2490 TaxID=1081109 RepID=A0A168F6L5_9HYPO|nr:Forkhead-associated (FHA) domain protein [Moelleriella libera RCEF 2490]
MDSSTHEAAAGPAVPSTAASSSPTSLAGTKRLLPPFEPLLSSPALPRPSKRQKTSDGYSKYPTPIPTSDTVLCPSPSERAAAARNNSERAPLSAVPTIELPENGDVITMGRSSNSSQVQLSSNRLISRVHLQAQYIPGPTPVDASRVEIVCHGWNGLIVHNQGRSWEIPKDGAYSSEAEGGDLIVDVLDARVMIQWPKRYSSSSNSLSRSSEVSWDDSPPRTQDRGVSLLQSSPLRRTARIRSPESPSPMRHASTSQAVLDDSSDDSSDEEDGIQIYEDAENEELPNLGASSPGVGAGNTQTTVSSELSDLQDEIDPDEENDPIVHSFGPCGANITDRFALISASPQESRIEPPRCFRSVASQEALDAHREVPIPVSSENGRDPTSSPDSDATDVQKLPPEEASSPAVSDDSDATSLSTREDKQAQDAEVVASVINHIVNQLAFSHLRSAPLAFVMDHLPAQYRNGLTAARLRDAIEATPCIGKIRRSGKDAAGKELETEYYYDLDNDDDTQRQMVVAAHRPTIRQCRKQHKQYFWKRPKTP